MSAMCKIERGVPMPDITGITGRSVLYPLAAMEVGDSFFAANIKSVRASASRASRLYGCKFVTRAVEGGIRVWRIA